MNKWLIGVIVIVVILGGWFFMQKSGGVEPLDLSTPEAVEESVENVSDELFNLEAEEEQVDAELDKLEALSF
jgi:hypothetical protein